jgi:Fe-S cluster assembly protein SufD
MTKDEISVASKKDAFLSALQGHTSALQNEQGLLQEATSALETLDFPTTRVEDWKYTRTARISNEQWQLVQEAKSVDIQPYLIPDLNAHLIVLVDGVFNSELSNIGATDFEFTLNKGQEQQNLVHKHIFSALNITHSTSALRVRVSKNVNVTKPVHVLHIASTEKALAQPTLFFHIEKSSSLHIVESYVCVGDVKTFTNRLLNITMDENAQVHFDKIQMEGDNNFLVNEENVYIASNGNFTINTLTVDGGWVRNGLNISLDGENIEANLNGFYLPRRKQHIDNHTLVDHRKPHSNSNELYKGILNDQGTGVFNGKVYVQLDAQKTNAFQSNANVLLSDDVQMNTKPELEIYADDVKCSHGTTTGQMDESALFYLKARGIGDDNARKLLAAAFINDVVNKVENEAVQNYVINQLVNRELLFV